MFILYLLTSFASAAFYNSSCLGEFEATYQACKSDASKCSVVLTKGVDCFNTTKEKHMFMDTYERGKCGYLKVLIADVGEENDLEQLHYENSIFTAGKNGESSKEEVPKALPQENEFQASNSKALHKLWAHNAELLKGTKYQADAEAKAAFYASKVPQLDVSACARWEVIVPLTAFTIAIILL